MKVKRCLAYLAAFVFTLTAFAGFAGGLTAGRTYADDGDTSGTGQTVNISNGNFQSASGSGYPQSADSWSGTALSGASGVKAGIVSLDSTKYNDNKEGYGLPEGETLPSYPFDDDANKNVLMINTSAAVGAYRFASEAVELSAHTRYEFSVWVYTYGFGTGGAAVKLIDSETNATVGHKYDRDNPAVPENLLSIIRIDTTEEVQTGDMEGWTQYRLYAETDYYSVSVKLALQVGGTEKDEGNNTRGVAFFNNVTARTVPYKTYKKLTQNISKYDRAYSFAVLTGASGVNDVRNVAEIEDYNAFTMKDTTDPYNWEILAGAYGAYEDGKPAMVPSNPLVLNYDNIEGESTVFEGKFLRIQHGATANATGIRTGDLTIGRYRMYRISVWYKTTNESDSQSASANIYLTGENTLVSEKYAPAFFGDSKTSASSGVSGLSSASNGVGDMAGWAQANIFIKGSPYADTTVNLELWLGYGGRGESTLSYGSVLFYDLRMEEFQSSAEYDKRKEAGTEIVIQSAYHSSDLNGYFDSYSFDPFTLPLTPSSWTFVQGDDSTIFPNAGQYEFSDFSVVRGVIANDSYSNEGGRMFHVPGSPGTYRKNVLMIDNVNKAAAGYKSADISVTANTYRKISVDVHTNIADTKTGATLLLLRNETVIAKIADINTGGAWETYSFVVGAGESDATVQLLLMNGVSTSGGTQRTLGQAYFARVETADSDETTFKSAQDGKADKTSAVDLISNFGLFEDTGKAEKTPYSFTGKGAGNDSNYTAGIIDIRSYRVENKNAAEGGASYLDLSSELTSYMLMIKNNTETAFKYTAKDAKTLSSGSFYQVTVSVMTHDIKGSGAYVGLAGIDGAEFKGIDTEKTGGTHDRFLKYNFYIETGEETLSFNYEFGLGDIIWAKDTSGYLFVEDMTVKNISRTAFNDALAVQDGDNPRSDTVALSFKTAVEDTTEKERQGFWDWYWLPTVIFGAAIVFVIIAVAVRKLGPVLRRKLRIGAGAKIAGYDRSNLDLDTGKVKKDSIGEYEDIVETKPKRAVLPEDETAATDEGAKEKEDYYSDYFED